VETAKSSHVTLNLPKKMQYPTQAKVVALANRTKLVDLASRSKLETLVKRIEHQWGDVVDEQWTSRQFQVCPGLAQLSTINSINLSLKT
jgi:hypothetical protein